MVGTSLVYDAFSKSVLQCFCRTCEVSAGEKRYVPRPCLDVVRQPPQKVAFVATEVCCTEQAKGGVKYELRLAEPTVEAPRASPVKDSNISEEFIMNKLQAAEKRRMSLGAERRNNIRNHMNEVKEKKEEFNNNFIQTTKESLEQKMESKKENRDNYLKSIQEKARDHVMKVEEVKKTLETPPQKEEALQSIKRKLEVASELRENQLMALQERLKEHDKHIEEVRKQLAFQTVSIRQKLEKKLVTAEEKKSALLKEIQEKHREHEKHIQEVRKSLGEQGEMRKEKLYKKLDEAQEKRETYLKEIQEKLKEHERHIEEVRKKAILANLNENTSG